MTQNDTNEAVERIESALHHNKDGMHRGVERELLAAMDALGEEAAVFNSEDEEQHKDIPDSVKRSYYRYKCPMCGYHAPVAHAKSKKQARCRNSICRVRSFYTWPNEDGAEGQ